VGFAALAAMFATLWLGAREEIRRGLDDAATALESAGAGATAALESVGRPLAETPGTGSGAADELVGVMDPDAVGAAPAARGVG
jgi:hypothetical protein